MTPWHGKIFALLRNKRKDGVRKRVGRDVIRGVRKPGFSDA